MNEDFVSYDLAVKLKEKGYTLSSGDIFDMNLNHDGIDCFHRDDKVEEFLKCCAERINWIK